MGTVGEVGDVHLHLAFIPDPEHCDHCRTCEVMKDFQNEILNPDIPHSLFLTIPPHLLKEINN